MATASLVPDNQLLRLFRLAHRQQENFTTESFAHVLQSLLALDGEAGVRLLNWLSSSDFFDPRNCDGLTVRTQFRTEHHGIPDVLIEADDLDLLVEVKLDGNLTKPQAEAHLRVLSARGRRRQRLVALMGSTPSNLLPDDPTLKVVTWGAVGVELRKAAAATDSHLAQHLIDQFIGLLKHLHLMPMQVRSGLSEELRAHREWASANRDKPSVFRSRVSSVDRLKTMEHTERLRNLLLQMDSMLTRAPAVERHRFDSSPYSREPWIGFSVNDMAYFFYVPLNQPETLLLKRFRTSIDPGAFDRSLGDLVPAPKGQMRWVARLDLLAPSPSFFDLDEDDQENRLGAFFDQAFAYAEGLQVSPGN